MQGASSRAGGAAGAAVAGLIHSTCAHELFLPAWFVQGGGFKLDA